MENLSLHTLILIPVFIALTACSGGNSYSSENEPEYTISGQINGLVGEATIDVSGGENLTLTQNRSFTFETVFHSEDAYQVSITQQPATQLCFISNENGSVAEEDISNISIDCQTAYTLSGHVYGLGGEIIVQTQAGEEITLTESGVVNSFGSYVTGDSYSLVITSQPNGQFCTLENQEGDFSDSNISTISIQCKDTYTVGGTINGLVGDLNLVLNTNTVETFSSLSDFVFSNRVANGEEYAVSIQTQPVNQYCSINNESGTIADKNIATVSIDCINTYEVSGFISGLTGDLSLSLNNQTAETFSTNGFFAFSGRAIDNQHYTVNVTSDPSGYYCHVANGMDTINSSAINDVSVTCYEETIVPELVLAVASNNTEITVAWIPTDYAAFINVNYELHASTTPSFSPSIDTLLQTVSNNSQGVISGLDPATTYYINIVAADDPGNRAPAVNELSATTFIDSIVVNPNNTTKSSDQLNLGLPSILGSQYTFKKSANTISPQIDEILVGDSVEGGFIESEQPT
jgi:hypothetical protein